MAKRKGLASVIETTSHDPGVRAVAATAVAGGALAAGKAVREKLAERRLSQRAKYRLGMSETPAEGIGRVAEGQLDLTLRLLDRAANGEDPADSVHEARKALKRLRALLKLSRRLLGDDAYRRENVALRDAGRELSDTRDAQVMVETLDALRARFPDHVPEGAALGLRESLSAPHQNGRASTGSNGPLGVVGELSEVRTRISTWPLPVEGDPRVLGDGVTRVYRRGRRALRAAEAEPSTENLHELRKRAKDLWHAGQLLRPTCPGRMKKLSRKAHRLSDLLGDDHDLAVLRERAFEERHRFGDQELERLASLIDRRRDALRGEALRHAAKLYRRKPRKLAKRMNLA